MTQATKPAPSPRLRVALWLPCEPHRPDIAAFLAGLRADGRVDIVGAALAPAPRRAAGWSTARACFAALDRFERLFARNDDNDPSSAGPPAADHLSLVAAGSLVALDPDLIVSLAATTPDPALFGSLRLGVLSLDEAEAEESIALRAVLDRQAGTPFRVRLTQPGGAPDKALFQGAFRTRAAWRENRLALRRRSLRYLHEAVGLLAEGRCPPACPDAPPKASVAPPTLRDAARYLAQGLANVVSASIAALPGRARREWEVGLAKGSWRATDFSAVTTLPAPHSCFVADPFLWSRDGQTCCFVEEYDDRTRKGVIAVYDVSRHPPVRLATAVEEPRHLSFPFLFKHDGALYMVPESAAARQIRLYRCVDFPTRWDFVKVLMDDVSAADTMIFPQAGQWWLFTNLNPLGGDHCSELSIFHAASPLSESWTPHPRNPVVIDPRHARNGGLILEGHDIYRVSQQQKFGTYGAACAIRRIVRLDAEAYEEELVCAVDPQQQGDMDRLHHICSRDGLIAFDFRQRR